MWLTDHPGWHTTENRGLHYRAVTSRTFTIAEIEPGAHRAVLPAGEVATLTTLAIQDGTPWLDPGNADCCLSTLVRSDSEPQELTDALASIRWVAHAAVGDLWEAVAGAVIRAATEPGRTRPVWQRFCLVHGDPVTRDGLTAWRFPRPQQLLAFPARAFTTTGAITAMRALRAAARACIGHAEEWQTYPTAALREELLSVPHLSPWTVGIAMAEYTGDYSHHPLDEAMRATIRHLVPGRNWPDHPEDFQREWNQFTGGHQALWNRWVCAWRLHPTPTSSAPHSSVATPTAASPAGTPPDPAATRSTAGHARR
ncbi:hypothetical protein [Nocardia wallacei]|uniref:hypothetical protein n=1 Tax=Nocardia wallacei TaxID=480035 RepID=UPI0024582AAC|nr:hypothetical protein [Nocardia wallacei]